MFFDLCISSSDSAVVVVHLFPHGIENLSRSDRGQGRILADLCDIWQVCLEIRPLQKCKETPRTKS